MKSILNSGDRHGVLLTHDNIRKMMTEVNGIQFCILYLSSSSSPPPQGLSIEGLESTSFISVPVYLSGFKSGKGSITTSQLLFSLSETNHWSQITWGAFGKELWQQERSNQDYRCLPSLLSVTVF